MVWDDRDGRSPEREHYDREQPPREHQTNSDRSGIRQKTCPHCHKQTDVGVPENAPKIDRVRFDREDNGEKYDVKSSCMMCGKNFYAFYR